jgi:hypothetical protein
MHYGMWPSEYYGPSATLDPAVFVETCARLGGPDTYVMRVGERLELPPSSTPPAVDPVGRSRTTGS